MKLDKIVNEINREKCNCLGVGLKVKGKCSDGRLIYMEGDLCECKIYKEIHLEDLLLAFDKINYKPFLNLSYGELQIGNSPRIDIKLNKKLSKQKPEVTKKLIEILS